MIRSDRFVIMKAIHRRFDHFGSLVALFLVACESSPVEPVEILTIDRTAIFDSIQVSLTAVNYSWMPREGPVPDPRTRRVTMEITALSYASGSRSLRSSEFRYRTWNYFLPYELSNTTLWSAAAAGRDPPLESVELQNGELFRGWLTFFVPAELSYLPDEFLWRPDPRVSFSFHLPTSSASLVCGNANIFGKVTDPHGAPVAGVPIELALFSLGWQGNSIEGGECRGEGSSTVELATDLDGRFEYRPFFRFCDERCVDLTVFAPEGSGLQSIRVSGRTVLPSAVNPLVEPSELRIDAVLPAAGE